AVNDIPDNSAVGHGEPVNSDGYATYHNVTLGQPGVFPQLADTAAGFNGTSSYVSASLQAHYAPAAIALWFNTTTPGGVLATDQNAAIGGTPTAARPLLYVGSDGKLYGQLPDGNIGPMASPGRVTDGKWHFVVLTLDSSFNENLFLDGAQ